jgi:hypothetical protein
VIATRTQRPSASAIAEAKRILDAEARRILAERLAGSDEKRAA